MLSGHSSSSFFCVLCRPTAGFLSKHNLFLLKPTPFFRCTKAPVGRRLQRDRMLQLPRAAGRLGRAAAGAVRQIDRF